MNNLHSILIIIVISIVTMLLRFIPFLIFGDKRKTPRYITYMGQVLPYAIMGMLVVYCLKEVSFISSPYGLPEIIACLFVVILHLWKRNTLVSIGFGTVCYMVLVQVVF